MKMLKIVLLLTENHRLLSAVAAIDMFSTVNRFLIEDGKAPIFDFELVGMSATSNLLYDFEAYPYYAINDYPHIADVILAPAFANYDMMQNIEINKAFIPFIIQQYNRGASLTSLCTGSFLLAASGLLNGKMATTHIDAVAAFAQVFPKVNIQAHAIVTESERIYTSGGATSSFHIKLLLIQKFCGREMAIRVAKNFAIDMDRNTQLYFETFAPKVNATDELVREVQQKICNEYSELKNVEDALDVVPSSRRNIARKFKQATGMTPIRFLQKTKIAAAKKELESTDNDILTVMVNSGYNDMKTFRQLFKNFTGMTPKDYRMKFGMRLDA